MMTVVPIVRFIGHISLVDTTRGPVCLSAVKERPLDARTYSCTAEAVLETLLGRVTSLSEGDRFSRGSRCSPGSPGRAGIHLSPPWIKWLDKDQIKHVSDVEVVTELLTREGHQLRLAFEPNCTELLGHQRSS
ncbi:hypothetical protein J6590_066797 [Homalodisca vitripennis]|nr:hypothetical protein J6590_066797 [Homalodisca vitripennis]